MKDRKVIRISGTMALVLFCGFMLLLIFLPARICSAAGGWKISAPAGHIVSRRRRGR